VVEGHAGQHDRDRHGDPHHNAQQHPTPERHSTLRLCRLN
jgi:hypothetical protein